jgi:hypothetical protein
MNADIWFSKVIQRNVATLKELGYYILNPSEGYSIADMQAGFGSIPKFSTIVKFIRYI